MINRTYFFSCIFILCVTQLQAQVSETFSDGDFTNDPVWVGNTADWIVNATGQLQSNNSVANSSFYLSTVNTMATETSLSARTALR